MEDEEELSFALVGLLDDDFRSLLFFLPFLFPLLDDLGGEVVSLLAAEGDFVVLAMDIPSMPLSKSSAFPVMMMIYIYIGSYASDLIRCCLVVVLLCAREVSDFFVYVLCCVKFEWSKGQH